MTLEQQIDKCRYDYATMKEMNPLLTQGTFRITGVDPNEMLIYCDTHKINIQHDGVLIAVISEFFTGLSLFINSKPCDIQNKISIL